ncbi:MAG: 5-(carboxyamino)imidazole ribonucleotide mutase [Elusimicrobia bacterium]|nr:5-(carboxyamino)imidazole ribonucleotide mutase [Elusimicrobiota bacterium]
MKKAQKPVIAILMGSESDRPVMDQAGAVLRERGLLFETRVLSAHRQPNEVAKFAKGARGRGIRVIIAGAGLAAHLAGAAAANTTLPVIGVPLSSGPLNGLDALLSTVQMPAGVPVATVAIGGAKNAAYLALRILSIKEK